MFDADLVWVARARQDAPGRLDHALRPLPGLGGGVVDSVLSSDIAGNGGLGLKFFLGRLRVPCRRARPRVSAAAAGGDGAGQRSDGHPQVQHLPADEGMTCDVNVSIALARSWLLAAALARPGRCGRGPARARRAAPRPSADGEGRRPPRAPPASRPVDVAKLRAEYDRLRDALFRARARARGGRGGRVRVEAGREDPLEGRARLHLAAGRGAAGRQLNLGFGREAAGRRA